MGSGHERQSRYVSAGLVLRAIRRLPNIPYAFRRTDGVEHHPALASSGPRTVEGGDAAYSREHEFPALRMLLVTTKGKLEKLE